MKTQKKFVKILNIIFTIIVILVILGAWLGKIDYSKEGQKMESTILFNSLLTLGGIFVVLLIWILYNNQKRQDLKRGITTE